MSYQTFIVFIFHEGPWPTGPPSGFFWSARIHQGKWCDENNDLVRSSKEHQKRILNAENASLWFCTMLSSEHVRSHSKTRLWAFHLYVVPGNVECVIPWRRIRSTKGTNLADGQSKVSADKKYTIFALKTRIGISEESWWFSHASRAYYAYFVSIRALYLLKFDFKSSDVRKDIKWKMKFTNWDTRTSVQKARFFDMYCHIIVHWQREQAKTRDEREGSRMRKLRWVTQ